MALLIFLVFAGNSIAGDWIKPGEEVFRIDAGAFFAFIDTSVRVDSKNLELGTDIDLEDDLGFDDSNTSFLMGGYWRFAKRHRLFASYFAIDRDTSGVLDEKLEIGGDIYPVDANVTSDFDFQIIPIAYGYSFVNNEKYEFTGIVGLHWYQVDFAISAAAVGGSGPGVQAATSVNADVPLPMLGFSYEYRFSDRWTAGALVQAFYLGNSSSLDFSGSLLNLGVKTEYWIFNNIGIGAALDYFKLDADVETDDWKGSLDYAYYGPKVYVCIRF